MALIDVERSVKQLCFKREIPEADLQGLGDRRVWLLYREMVRERLWDELHVTLPRTCAAAGDGALQTAFDRFLDEEPPHSRFFHELPLLFVQSTAESWRGDSSLPRHLADLAAYEATLCEVSDLGDPPLGPVVDFAFDKRPVLSPALRLLRTDFAVHEGPTAGLNQPYKAGRFHLAVHRAADDQKVQTWQLNATTYELMLVWQSARVSVSDAIAQVAKARNIAVDATFVDGLCTVLADFIERGIVLGSM